MITLHSHFSRFFGMISNYGSGGAQHSLSLSFPFQALINRMIIGEYNNIHTCLCFKMHVSDYYESNEGSCNSPIYNKW